jgi:hypothetical protein
MLWFNYYREKKINLTLDNKIVNKTEIQKLELVLNTIYNDIAITKLSLTTIKNQKSKFKN